LVNLARHRKVDAETALRDATKRFRSRVQKVEAMARRTGKSTASLSPKELDRLWTKAKRS
jgi:ATP diphosphatase